MYRIVGNERKGTKVYTEYYFVLVVSCEWMNE